MREPRAETSVRNALLVVILATLASRIAYWPTGILGKDGPAYINGLKLDSTYSVPPPGNIGWVLLAKPFAAVMDPVNAFTVVAILVSVFGTAYFFLLCTLFLRPWMAAATALAAALSPLVWYHAVPLMSYEVWLAAPPVIAYYGVRYWSERRLGLLYGAAAATGLASILRPDIVTFAGPLLGGVLLIGRAPLLRGWVACAAICAACCAVWFGVSSAIMGGPAHYIGLVRNQSEYINTFSTSGKGLFEGLARNGSKYAMMLAWGSLFVALPALLGLLKLIGSWRAHWRFAVLGALAVVPSLYFGIWLFMGNAGLVLPMLGAMFLLAGFGLDRTFRERRPAVAIWAISIVGLLGAGQFVLTPLLEPKDQRNVILNVTFLRYSGHGVRRLYNYNLVDFGIDSTLSNTLKQMRTSEPVPAQPSELK